MKVLLITGNIGSLFEEFGSALQKNWLNQYSKLVESERPLFIGLHFQEIGGKSQVVDSEKIATFFYELKRLPVHHGLSCFYSYIDKEYDEQKYTALGCCYFIHQSLLSSIKVWNFKEKEFQPLIEGEVLLENYETVQKYKYPLSCFSKKTRRWPRKGFTWTRWNFKNEIIDMVNVHLSHDACNVSVSMKSVSKYSKYRKRALVYTLEQLHTLPSYHHLLYGDFNVRPETKELIEHIMKNKGNQVINHIHTNNNNNNKKDGKPYKVVYQSLNGSMKDLLIIEDRLFILHDYDDFAHDKIESLLQFDKELDWLKNDSFKEMQLNFIPTYPHVEDPYIEDYLVKDPYIENHHVEGSKEISFKHTFGNVRCPSWCDRILADSSFFEKYISCSSVYNIFGEHVILGDHKPVYMAFEFPFGLLADQ
ncbi:inositol polyphosphate-5-phosphatase A isoform X2 [Hydra vulgaris]|uniref:inositol-polyphosphate 5-phosphatase n=1 Tax=Hydra vulgaris TaxID=6087 RepID=A0ABM4BH18_HYDVU